MFPPNVIHGPHAPRPVAPYLPGTSSLYPYGAIPQPQPAALRPGSGCTPDVPEAQFKAAQDIYATHLSNDGKYAYRDDRGYPEVAKWNERTRRFESYWKMADGAELPADAVAMN